MKNFINFLKAQLFLMVVLCCIKVSYAQTVTVPANCRVVTTNTGIGGVLGFGGKVTDGGIVAMPDQLLVSPFTPNQGGPFTFALSGVASATWSLKGDLSNTIVAGAISGVVGNYNGATQPAASLSANIFSYNKAYRANSTETSNPSWARSKGQVKVSWFLTGCGSSIIFDVYKNFTSTPVTNVPIIVGPDCLKPNTTYTYSVDRIVSDNTTDNIGFDSYYWSGLPANIYPATVANSFYTSADNSSITFTTASTVAPFTLQCCYGRVNPNTGDGGVSSVLNTFLAGSHTTCISKPLLLSPVAPTFNTLTPATLGISNTVFNGCLATGLTSFVVNYNLPPAGTTYTWSAPGTNWNIGFSTTGTQTMTVSNLDNSSGTLKLTVSNGSCTPVDFIYQINRTFTTAIAITPGTTNCLVGGVGSTFSIGPNASVNATNWTVTPAPAVGTFYINTNTATTTVTVSSSANVSPGTYTLTATSANCGGSITLPVNVKPAAPTVVLGTTPPTCVPLSSVGLTTFSVTSPGATSYTWTLPTGWTNVGTPAQQTSGNPTLVPPVNNSAVGAAALPADTISVVANSGTGCSSTATTFAVNYIRITTNTLQAGAGNCDQYSINTNIAPCTGTITNWQVGGVTAVSNGTTVNIFGNTLTLCGSTAPTAGTICANIVVNGVAYNTCSSTAPLNVPNHGLKQANSASVHGTRIEGVIISPNPNSGTFSINVNTIKDSASATLYDMNGKNLGTYPLNRGENRIEIQGLAQGTYIVSLSIDGKTEGRQIIIK